MGRNKTSHLYANIPNRILKGAIFVSYTKITKLLKKKMIQEINHDLAFLSQKAEKATEADKQVIEDLLDTLRAHLEECVGMAANMIGVNKSIIVFCKGKKQIAMVNPVIIKKDGPYAAEETCLSVPGSKQIIRYNEIEVVYLDSDFKRQRGKFSGWTAQIIQHEIDHTNGVLV